MTYISYILKVALFCFNPQVYTSYSKNLKSKIDFDFLQSGESLWLGLHEPDPQNYPDVRVWSSCGASGYTNWNSNNMPSEDVYDMALCVVINTTSLVWSTVNCNEPHEFICITESTGKSCKRYFVMGIKHTCVFFHILKCLTS